MLQVDSRLHRGQLSGIFEVGSFQDGRDTDANQCIDADLGFDTDVRRKKGFQHCNVPLAVLEYLLSIVESAIKATCTKTLPTICFSTALFSHMLLKDAMWNDFKRFVDAVNRSTSLSGFEAGKIPSFYCTAISHVRANSFIIPGVARDFPDCF